MKSGEKQGRGGAVLAILEKKRLESGKQGVEFEIRASHGSR